MNRKRKVEESFEDYRASQKAERDRIKQHLMGNYFHTSKVFTAEGRPLPGVTYAKKR